MTRSTLHHSLICKSVIASLWISKGAVPPHTHTPPHLPEDSDHGQHLGIEKAIRRPAGSAGRGQSSALPLQAWSGAGVTGRPLCRKDGPEGGGGGRRSRVMPEPSPPARLGPQRPPCRAGGFSLGAAGTPASARGSPELGPPPGPRSPSRRRVRTGPWGAALG